MAQPLTQTLGVSLGILGALIVAKLAAPDRKTRSISTWTWSTSDCIYPLVARWRVHWWVFRAWLPGKLGLRVAIDPTTGSRRKYWSYKADAYEQLAPRPALTNIKDNFNAPQWESLVSSRVDAAAGSSTDLLTQVDRLVANGWGAPNSSTGNSVRFPSSGHQAYEWRRRLIRGAQKRIYFMTAYISVDDDARGIVQDLVDTARRGVQVLVSLDNFGADAFLFCGVDTRYKRADEEMFGYTDLVRLLKDNGIQVTFWRPSDCIHARTSAGSYKPTRPYELFDCKNHAKGIIVDGEVALLTDRNVGSCYFRNPAYSSTEVVVMGPCVSELEKKFYNLWESGGGPPIAPVKTDDIKKGALFQSLSDIPEDDSDRLASGVAGAVLASMPRDLELGEDPILLGLLLAIRNAKKSVDMMFAYMELCRPLRDELIKALKRGVSVRIVTNSRETNDLFWINVAFLESALPVVQAGGKLVMAVCTPEAKGHVHAKIAVIDERFLIVGSWNAWLRSSLYEAEIDVLLDTPKLARRTTEFINGLASSGAYQLYDEAMIKEEILADPLGLDPAVEKFIR